ncbi:MAG: SAM-dependent methyltransferase [Rhizobiales bacterium]|nr:SAM-dependent methyltransferase [Hyphomicrobiales bacterium]
MELCLTHPQHGYYVSQDPIGAGGDFITAPEVSQMFGELIGLWAAAVWSLMGSPQAVNLIELGPGRGTMMRDALRAARVTPAFHSAIGVHLVEISPVLEQHQRTALTGERVDIAWHRSLDNVPDGPAIIVANEFVDALPVHQMVKQDDGWHERTVSTVSAGGGGEFVFGVSREPVAHFDRIVPTSLREAAAGEIFEWRSDNMAFDIGRRVVRAGGAALVIDYGHVISSFGDTLQSVGGHGFTDPLIAPGLVDLTAHVDFQAFRQAAESMGARAHGPVDQGAFLRRLGIEARATALKSNTDLDSAARIDAALARLTASGRTGMGTMFKVLGLADPKLGSLPGLEN